MVLVAIAAIIIIITLAAVTGLAIQYAKESHVKGSVFVDKGGNPVQCASNEIEMGSDGLLKNKQGEGGVRTLKALAISHPLNSKVPDK